MKAFAEAFEPTRTLLIGHGGVPLDEFLSRPAEYWLPGR
jgi:hypothetical protein